MFWQWDVITIILIEVSQKRCEVQIEELQTLGLFSKIIGSSSSSYEVWFDPMLRYKAFNNKTKFNKLCVEWNVIDVEIVVTKKRSKMQPSLEIFLTIILTPKKHLLNVSHSWVGMGIIIIIIIIIPPSIPRSCTRTTIKHTYLDELNQMMMWWDADVTRMRQCFDPMWLWWWVSTHQISNWWNY
jgi:hypothetical protein